LKRDFAGRNIKWRINYQEWSLTESAKHSNKTANWRGEETLEHAKKSNNKFGFGWCGLWLSKLHSTVDVLWKNHLMAVQTEMVYQLSACRVRSWFSETKTCDAEEELFPGVFLGERQTRIGMIWWNLSSGRPFKETPLDIGSQTNCRIINEQKWEFPWMKYISNLAPRDSIVSMRSSPFRRSSLNCSRFDRIAALGIWIVTIMKSYSFLCNITVLYPSGKLFRPRIDWSPSFMRFRFPIRNIVWDRFVC
jgi:hypothetical protein